MEYDNKWASVNGKANAGLVTGIIGATGVGASIAASLLGINGNNCNGFHGQPAVCNENMPVNRYEAAMSSRISELETEVKLRDANTYTDQKDLEVYKFFAGEIKDIRADLAAQAVVNQKTADSFALAAADLAATKRELCGQIQLEAERRCCADNSIVTYANATFYPKLVADITAGTTTTAQVLYNPIPNCGGCCNK